MNWIIVFLTAIITTLLVLTACGVGGGIMVLVILNGLSESAATPFLIFFALIVIGGSVALSTAASWMFIKARHAENNFRFWQVAGINAGVNILTILIILTTVTVLRLQQ